MFVLGNRTQLVLNDQIVTCSLLIYFVVLNETEEENRVEESVQTQSVEGT